MYGTPRTLNFSLPRAISQSLRTMRKLPGGTLFSLLAIHPLLLLSEIAEVAREAESSVKRPPVRFRGAG